MANDQKNVVDGLTWIGTTLQYVKEYGVWNIVKASCVLVFLSIMFRIIYDPAWLFDKYQEYAKDKHEQELVTRTMYDQKIKQLLPVYLYKYQADRVWIIQYHNGTKDWQHGTMRFERCGEGINSIRSQYVNFNLTWLELPYYLLEEEIFIGNLSDLQKIDPVVFSRFVKNGVQYVACILIRDSLGNPQGVFGVTWDHIPENLASKRYKIHDYLLTDRGELKMLLQGDLK